MTGCIDRVTNAHINIVSYSLLQIMIQRDSVLGKHVAKTDLAR